MRSQYISAAGLALVVASSMTVQAADLGGYESFKDAPPARTSLHLERRLRWP